MLKKHLFLISLIILVIPAFALASDINLPHDLKAKASVIKSEKDKFWEKTLVIQFPERRRVFSTIDGFLDVTTVINHSAQPELWMEVCEKLKTKDEVGGKIYIKNIKEKTASRLGIRSSDIAQFATAANMDNLAIVTKIHEPFIVTALVTAGAKSNALRTGVDEGRHIEGEEPKGTVNILILTNARLTDGAMARAVITATEAKTAAFEDLQVPSTYSKNIQATGTGTDNVIVVSGASDRLVTYTGGHSKMGELIGKAVHQAVMEGLIKQNGFKKKTAD